MSVRTIALFIGTVCLIPTDGLVAQQTSRPFTWPLSGTNRPSAPIATTFGPRLRVGREDGYSFHRGIDIPAEVGQPVYAIKEGVVRIAGEHAYYQTPLVQLRHYKNQLRTCKDGGCFYSNYMHLSSVQVTEGQKVKQGDIIGFTGSGLDGFPHLHFEIRDAGIYQEHCVHPLAVLPYVNRSAPKIAYAELSATAGGLGKLTVTIQTGRNECDLRRVNVTIAESPRSKFEVTYDMVNLNQINTPRGDPNGRIHSRDLQNVIARPKPLAHDADYELTLVFHDLPNVKPGSLYHVKLQALDVRGKSSDVARRVRAVATR